MPTFDPHLLDSVQSRVAGAPLAVVEQELDNAFREFTRRSLAWTVELTLAVTAPTATYTLTSIVSGTMVTYIIQVRGPDGELAPGDLFFSNPGPLRTYTCPQVGTIRLSPAPATDTTLTITAAVTPNSKVYTPPAGFESMWHEALQAGALARLHSTAGRPYTSAPLATYFAKRFRTEIANAKAASVSGFTQGQGPWAFPMFA